MCGIAGVYGKEAVKKSIKITIGQWNRGTQGTGIAWQDVKSVKIKKSPIDQITFYEENKNLIDIQLKNKKISIAHNRLPAGSGVSYENTHPFLSEDGSFALIHNGVLWKLKPTILYLKKRGHVFQGETDSEVAMHTLEEILIKNGGDYVQSMEELGYFFNTRGSFAFLILTHEGNIYGIRNTKPIRVVYWKNDTYICSDEQALIELGIQDEVKVFEPNPLNVITIEDGESYVYGYWSEERVPITGQMKEEPPYSVPEGYVMCH